MPKQQLGFSSGSDFRSGFVAVIGRPNAGKSTLLNALLGQKILIMSDKPQTTRNTIRCIVTEPVGQAIFLDTPGIHKAKDKLGTYMLTSALRAIEAVDAVLWVTDITSPWGPGDAYIAEVLGASHIPTLLALNKVDLINKNEKETLLSQIKAWSQRFDFKEIVPVSALQGENTPSLMDVLWGYLPSGPMYYPADEVTDQPERFIAAEIVREKLFALTREEIPYSVGVIVEQMEEKISLIKIEASIFVERPSQKGIVIGKEGALLKKVGQQARLELEGLLGSKVLLKLWVKVRKDWRNRLDMLRELGYDARKG